MLLLKQCKAMREGTVDVVLVAISTKRGRWFGFIPSALSYSTCPLPCDELGAVRMLTALSCSLSHSCHVFAPGYLWCLLGGTAAYLWLSLMQRGLEGCRAGMTLLCLPSFLVASLGIWYFPSLAVFEICSTPYLLCCFTWCLHFQASWSGFKLFPASSVWDVVTRLSLMLPLQ